MTVTKEQIYSAKQIPAIEFLRQYRQSDLMKAGRDEYQLKSHDSFKINGHTSLWHWKSRDIDGRSALDFLIKVDGINFTDAVLMLCGEKPALVTAHEKPKNTLPFVLPKPSTNNGRVIAYLTGRGISGDVIKRCIQCGMLYESAKHHNAVFVGHDDHGAARYAFMRGTYTIGRPFKLEVPGSDRDFPFCLPPEESTKRIAVYESAIDALAHLTLEKCADKYRLSLGGVSLPPLDAFLNRHPEVEEIEVCTDNDIQGRRAAEQIERTYRDKYRVVKNLPVPVGYDYADIAKEVSKLRT